MDFTIEKVIILNKKIKDNKINKQQLIKYRNKNVIRLLCYRKKYLKSKIIDLDNYKPLSLCERIKRKQKKQIKRDNIDYKISNLVQINNYRLSNKKYCEFYNGYFNYLSYDFYLKFDYKDIKVKYRDFKNQTFQYIIDLLIISKNINNYQRRKNEKMVEFKLRVIDKLIDYMYNPTPNQSN